MFTVNKGYVMTAPNVAPGLGTLLQLEISSTFTTIAQRVTISGPTWEVGTTEITNLDSAAKEYRATIQDSGEVSCQIQYDPSASTHAALTTLMLTPATKNWKLIFADSGAAIYAFAGILTKFEPSGMEVEGNVVADIAIKLTGVITITP